MSHQNILPYRPARLHRTLREEGHSGEERVFRWARQSAVVDMPLLAPMLKEEAIMRELLVVFQEGFDEANITVTVNGKEVRRDLGVSTNPLLGIASEVSVELPAKGAQVGVEVTNRGLKAITKVSGKPKSVLVSIEDGHLLMKEGTGREAVL
ncbi:hypothetical protein GCM10007170_24650 [Arthrobacter liuii]|uniref:Uncharacterized protein n=2 Tax=Arthrobacter liuii TaxID=1476996 RepID=A0ABQ2AVG5_9MICC|nr:hypothetical protein GCM10007170_24650 [Arthrobacter liuii]